MGKLAVDEKQTLASPDQQIPRLIPTATTGRGFGS
jgi:hypothetical protein